MIRCGRCGTLLDETDDEQMLCPVCGAQLKLDEEDDPQDSSSHRAGFDSVDSHRPTHLIEPRTMPHHPAPNVTVRQADPGLDLTSNVIRCGRCGSLLDQPKSGRLQCPVCGAMLNFDDDAAPQDDFPYFVGGDKVDHQGQTYPIEVPLIPLEPVRTTSAEASSFSFERPHSTSPSNPSLMGLVAGLILLIALLALVAIVTLISLNHR